MKPLKRFVLIPVGAIASLASLSSSKAAAMDCSREPPFRPLGSVKARVSLAHGFRTSDGQKWLEEDVCTKEISLSTFDVRGREEAAYYCLKPLPEEVVVCETTFNYSPAEFAVVPAIWQRTARDRILIETRFHGYIQVKLNPQSYLDIFSRSLHPPPLPDEIVLEGAVSSGSASPLVDDYWVRIEVNSAKGVPRKIDH